MKERRSALTPNSLHRPPVKHPLNSTCDLQPFQALLDTLQRLPVFLCILLYILQSTPGACARFGATPEHRCAISHARVFIPVFSDGCWRYRRAFIRVTFEAAEAPQTHTGGHPVDASGTECLSDLGRIASLKRDGSFLVGKSQKDQNEIQIHSFSRTRCPALKGQRAFLSPLGLLLCSVLLRREPRPPQPHPQPSRHRQKKIHEVQAQHHHFVARVFCN